MIVILKQRKIQENSFVKFRHNSIFFDIINNFQAKGASVVNQTETPFVSDDTEKEGTVLCLTPYQGREPSPPFLKLSVCTHCQRIFAA